MGSIPTPLSPHNYVRVTLAGGARLDSAVIVIPFTFRKSSALPCQSDPACESNALVMAPAERQGNVKPRRATSIYKYQQRMSGNGTVHERYCPHCRSSQNNPSSQQPSSPRSGSRNPGNRLRQDAPTVSMWTLSETTNSLERCETRQPFSGNTYHKYFRSSACEPFDCIPVCRVRHGETPPSYPSAPRRQNFVLDVASSNPEYGPKLTNNTLLSWWCFPWGGGPS